jgi:hypothetical protein
MNKFAIIGACKAPRTGYIAIISGALLGAVAAVGPAKSGDLAYPYDYTGHYTGYRPGYDGFHRDCFSYRCDCCRVVRRFVPEFAPAVEFAHERHWVQREYFERRFPIAAPRFSHCGFPRCDFPRGYARPYYGGYAGGYPYYSGPSEPRPHLGFGGVQYPPHPISYEYEAPPRPSYEYEASRAPVGMPYYNAGYGEEPPPRPPVSVPYYNAGYAE